jgi:hypothetical protein
LSQRFNMLSRSERHTLLNSMAGTGFPSASTKVPFNLFSASRILDCYGNIFSGLTNYRKFGLKFIPSLRKYGALLHGCKFSIHLNPSRPLLCHLFRHLHHRLHSWLFSFCGSQLWPRTQGLLKNQRPSQDSPFEKFQYNLFLCVV